MPSVPIASRRQITACFAPSVAALAIFLHGPLAGAATDGHLGSMSTGSVGIHLTKATVVRVSGIRDMHVSPGTDVDETIDICVFSSNGRYQITSYADSSARSGFALRGLGLADGRSLPYRVYWNETPFTNTGEVAMQPGVTLEGLHVGGSTHTDCGGGSTARVRLEISTLADDPSDAGGFAGQLTLVLSPV